MSARLSTVTMQYAGQSVPALRDVSLRVDAGELTLLTGRTGAGCSTLLLVMAGLAPRVTGGSLGGRVEVLGIDVRDDAARPTLAGRIGLLLPSPWIQLSGLAYTVHAEVAFGPANLGWSRERIGVAVERALHELGVAHLADRDPTTLSGGELQRVMLAGVLAMEPDVLLLDEPAGELDPTGARHVYQMLAMLARDRIVVVAATDVDRAAELAGRVVVLEGGRVIADGEPADVLGTAARVADATSTTVAAIMHAAGWPELLPITVADAVARAES